MRVFGLGFRVSCPGLSKRKTSRIRMLTTLRGLGFRAV